MSVHGGASLAHGSAYLVVESAAPPSTPSRRARERDRIARRRRRCGRVRVVPRRRRSSRTSARTSRATPPASSASRRGWRVRSAASVDAAFLITRVPTPSTRCRRRDPQRVHASRLGRGDGVSATSRRRDAADAAASAGDRENASTPSTRRVRPRSRPSQITRSSGTARTPRSRRSSGPTRGTTSRRIAAC